MDSPGFRPRPVVLALLCLAALAFAAATLDTTTTPESDFGLGNPSSDSELGNPDTPVPSPTDEGADDEGRPSIIDTSEGTLFNFCETWLTQTRVQLALLGALAALFLLIRWARDAALAFSIVFVIAYPGLFLYLILTACGSPTTGFLGLSPLGEPTEEGGGVFGGTSAVTSPDLPTFVLLVLTGAALVVVGVLVLTGDHEQPSAVVDDEEADPEIEEGGGDVAAVGRAAGRAADRIERSDEFENEVYRAWAEMTEPLSVERPESSTPAEFASAAVDAGMAAEDVDRITDLFEEVRYGGAAATAERERAAVETLRRIEATYAGDDA